jgi:hypothetical protein
MYKRLKGKFAPPSLELKSKDQHLSEENKKGINQFIV